VPVTSSPIGRSSRLQSSLFSDGFFMACRAEGDQILVNVIVQLAPPLNVMDLKILHAPARLTTPVTTMNGAWPF
jgi:hypothetical protein